MAVELILQTPLLLLRLTTHSKSRKINWFNIGHYSKRLSICQYIRIRNYSKWTGCSPKTTHTLCTITYCYSHITLLSLMFYFSLFLQVKYELLSPVLSERFWLILKIPGLPYKMYKYDMAVERKTRFEPFLQEKLES